MNNFLEIFPKKRSISSPDKFLGNHASYFRDIPRLMFFKWYKVSHPNKCKFFIKKCLYAKKFARTQDPGIKPILNPPFGGVFGCFHT